MSKAPQDLDSVVALIAGTPAQEVEAGLIPVLKKLDKAAEQASSSSSGASRQAPASRTRGDASSSSSGGAAAGSSAAPAHLLEGRMKDGQDPLDVLTPGQHTVGYLYILNARLAANMPDLATLGPKILGFAEGFVPQEARQVGEQVSYFASQLVSLAQSTREASSTALSLLVEDPAISVNAFKTLVQRYSQPGYLTHLHPQFLQLVMATGQYPAALEVLSDDINDFDKQLYPVKYQDHLLYHYLGGTILALSRDYTRAADLLEIAVSAPGSSASMIQIDAFKKLVLVQLLAHGRLHPLPKYTSNALSQAIKALCGGYIEYASAFVSLNRKKIDQAREKGWEGFEKDLNTGLVHLCDASLRRRQIQHLTQTYITQSLGEITAQVGMDPNDEKALDAVETEIRGMIATKQIFATFTPSPSSTSRAQTTITFSDDPEPFISHETVERVTKAIQEAQELEERWAAEGRKMAEGKEFVQKAWSAAASGGNAGAGIGGFGSLSAFSDELDYGSSAAMGGIPGGWEDGAIEMDSD
ncbi:hypothetical protein JCM11641_007895 [Rhodosporidiobolus odoratus]